MKESESIYMTTSQHPELKKGIKLYVDSRDNVWHIGNAFFCKERYNRFYAYSAYINNNLHKGWFEKIQ